MSKFSGKCDVYDWFYMNNSSEEDLQKEISRTDFYIYDKHDKQHRLDINTIKDLVSYYPYLVSIGCHNKDKSFIVLSQCSYVDQLEEEVLTNYLERAIKEYKKCKRNKIDFDIENYFKISKSFYDDCDPYKEILKRVLKDGKKATINGIHLKYKDYYRTMLYDEMIKNDYTEEQAAKWVFNADSLDEIKNRLVRY